MLNIIAPIPAEKFVEQLAIDLASSLQYSPTNTIKLVIHKSLKIHISITEMK